MPQFVAIFKLGTSSTENIKDVVEAESIVEACGKVYNNLKQKSFTTQSSGKDPGMTLRPEQVIGVTVQPISQQTVTSQSKSPVLKIVKDTPEPFTRKPFPT